MEVRTRMFFLYATASLCMLSAMYLKFHFDYDRFHAKSDRIYIVTTKLSTPYETTTTSISSGTTASTIKSNSKFVEQTARLAYSQVRMKGNSLLSANGLFADASILEIFDLPLISGNKKTALYRPFSIVLTKDAAVKLFGHHNPLGKLVFLEDFDCAATVTAIAKNLPDNSQIKTDAFISMPTLVQLNDSHPDNSLEAISVITYILLKPNVSAKLTQEELSNSLSAGRVEKQKLLLNKKNIILKPLRGTLLNPVLTHFQILSIYTAVVIFFLMLLASVKRVIKIMLLQISLSSQYMTITLKQRNRKLAWKVCSVTAVIYLFSYFTSVGLMSGLKYIFDITMTESPYPPLYFGIGMLIIMLTTSIFLSLWIAYRIPAEPIRTYLILKKNR
ncbi:ABC transporter permease [Dyadobacter sp. LJ53]|uniref:ABC transporter permease n=1 Tax=Dyadobacter chenwenxiniae TaxID=2906456 RepID=UPI001F1C3B24|nr:ABC transporter permease [Dyadobacter chenwenxiniae]MCF0049044.1 ABC transporter permease [Dyadobacter chenwenxiniae]